MQGVPGQFTDTRDHAQFRHLPQLPGVELYHAHISRYRFEPHTHEAFGIGAIESGAERFRYRGSQYVAPADSLVMMNPDELHTGQSETEDGWRYRMIYLEPELLTALTGEARWWFKDVVQYDRLRARQVSDLIFQLWHTDDLLAQQSQLVNLIDIVRPYGYSRSQSLDGKMPRFERVREYLHDNYMQNVSLQELADLVALTPWYFLRQFKAHYHVTPHQMLMAIRLWRAKQFLSQGIPAAEVAAVSGLTDQSHLTRAFTRRYGITPVRYQKQVRP